MFIQIKTLSARPQECIYIHGHQQQVNKQLLCQQTKELISTCFYWIYSKQENKKKLVSFDNQTQRFIIERILLWTIHPEG